MRILVIGAGPAGLTAAISAAKEGADVVIIEHQNKIGKKLSITGNGKGNITNLVMDSQFFYGDKSFIDDILSQFNEKDTLCYFNELGICTESKNGYIYPMGEQASFISNRLRDYATNLGVKIKTNNNISYISKNNNRFNVNYGIEDEFDKIILATGGKSFENTGSNGSGYDLANKLGHKINSPKPALTALVVEKDILSKASGVRINATITLDDTYKEYGQLQITDYGISGIPVFNLSRNSVKKSIITIDFIPQYNTNETIEKLMNISLNRSFNIFDVLCGLFNDKLSTVFIEKAGYYKTDKPNLEMINEIVSIIKAYKLVVQDRKGFDFAQVTAGGVSTNEINSKTMESNILPGLYFAGEIIDVDGKCGGYNLQFAWSSGTIAGRNACK